MKQEGSKQNSRCARCSLTICSQIKLSLLLSIAIAALGLASAADVKSEELARATVVQAWDERVSILNSPPVTITNLSTVTALVSAIQTAPGRWEKGWFTAPSGYIRFVFRKDSRVIAVIGLGQQFLVRGGGGDWESMKISKQLEAQIASFGQQGPSDKSLQPNP